MIGEIGDRHIGVERRQARAIETDPGPEEAQLAAEEDDADVQPLAALDAGDDPQDHIGERR